MSLVSRYEFQKCVDRYKGDWHAKTLTCLDQFKIMSFAQFTDRSSLRDIEMTLEFCGKVFTMQVFVQFLNLHWQKPMRKGIG